MTTAAEPIPDKITKPLYLGAAMLVLFVLVFAIWSVTAKLSTTVHAQGMLISSRSSFDIQHGFGGQITWVGVKPQDTVTAGTPLFRMDVSTETATLEELNLQIDDLTADVATIEAILDSWPNPSGSGAYGAQMTATLLKVETLQNAAVGYWSQADAGTREVQLLGQRIALLKTLESKTKRLLDRGYSKSTVLDLISGQILELAGEQEQRIAARLALENQALQAETDAKSAVEDFRARLLTELQSSRRRISELRREVYRLNAIVAAAEIEAPADGQIQTLTYDTPHMYAPRGQTLAVLTQDLDAPGIRLTLPTSVIDQVRIGMTGRLTISSLPQRELPSIRVVVTAISPEAEKDQDGAPRGYVATAEIQPDDLERARQTLKGRFKLATDMPVSVALAGRETTLYNYLIAPFMTVFSNALQD